MTGLTLREQPDTPLLKPRRSVGKLLAPLDLLAGDSSYLGKSQFRLGLDGEAYMFSRYVFRGPQCGGDPMRIGLFATLHGDEPEGTLGLIRFIEELTRTPELATGYYLYIYPVCNPTGFEDNTRRSRHGLDLNREFWKDSIQPEVLLLQYEIATYGFHGIVSLHADDTSSGLYGYVQGADLTEYLLEPALKAAERVLPRNRNKIIDGFKASKGIIYEVFEGVLKSPPGLESPPFEITLETPQKTPAHRQAEAFALALKTILAEYRYLQAMAPNL